jgi:Zn-dependent protease with chaperone function
MIRTSLVATGVALLACGIGLAQEVEAQLANQDPSKTYSEKSAQEIVNAAGPASLFNIQAQTSCETEMLDQLGAREVFSGKAYEALTDIASAYGRAIPHIYVYPGNWNMAYIASSAAVDGRGKIVVGQQAIESFSPTELRGFLGHEMAHLVSDNAAHGCNDYVIRDPQVESDADALAARVLGVQPVKAFLERARALAHTEGMDSDAKSRLELLQ